jgi:DNA polymerase-3 subunit delta'
VSVEIQTTVLDGAVAPAANRILFGHDQAQAFLGESYASGKGHHAVLIEGPEGVGKATLAFRFANHVLNHPDVTSAPHALSDPDPSSPVFRQIAGGASHNLLYLTRPTDPKTGKLKSGITVDDVRKAGKFFAQTSGTGNWRIVIVDTADELNRNAANAILKMLEEPPKRAMFLVLSHAPGKLLPTIRSRCLPLALRPLSDADLVKALANLGIALPQQGTAKILALAGGSVAQAIKLINYGGLDVIDAFNAALSATGPAQRKAMHKLADAVAQKDGDTLYSFFIEHLGDHVSAQAKAAAMRGELDRAYGLSRLQSAVIERFTVADAYNLERKQTVLTVLGEVAAEL